MNAMKLTSVVSPKSREIGPHENPSPETVPMAGDEPQPQGCEVGCRTSSRNLAEASPVKRASYREAVAWVAENDSGGESDALRPEVVCHLITAALVADIFGVPSERVGNDIVNYRLKHGWERT